MKLVLSLLLLTATAACSNENTPAASPLSASASATNHSLDTALFSFDSETGGPVITANIDASLGTSFRRRARSRVFDGLTWLSQTWYLQRQGTLASEGGGIADNATIRTACHLIGMEGMTRPMANGAFIDWSGLKVSGALVSAEGGYVHAPVTVEGHVEFLAQIFFDQSPLTNPDEMAGITCNISVNREGSPTPELPAVLGPTWRDVQDAFQGLVTLEVAG